MAKCKTCVYVKKCVRADNSNNFCPDYNGSGNVEAAALSDDEKSNIDYEVDNSYPDQFETIRHIVERIITNRLATQKTEMASIDETEIRICEGCGRVEIKGDNGVRPPAIACCPDNTYHTIAQILAAQKSKMLALIPGPKTIDKADWADRILDDDADSRERDERRGRERDAL